MAVTHVLKNGTVLRDIKGHVVRVEDAKLVYTIMDKLNERGRKEKADDQQVRGRDMA